MMIWDHKLVEGLSTQKLQLNDLLKSLKVYTYCYNFIIGGINDSPISKITKRPLVNIDVNLGKDKGKQKLVIYNGDSPSAKAKEFAELHRMLSLIIIKIFRITNE